MNFSRVLILRVASLCACTRERNPKVRIKSGMVEPSMGSRRDRGRIIFNRETHPLSSDWATCFRRRLASYFLSSSMPCHECISTVGKRFRGDSRSRIRPPGDRLKRGEKRRISTAGFHLLIAPAAFNCAPFGIIELK